MNLIKADKSNIKPLFSFWNEIGENVPYFFKANEEQWVNCLFEDLFNGESIFKHTEIYYVMENQKVLGFIQYGEPNFHWTSKGEKISNPNIGVIRNLYFVEDRFDVGKLLIKKAEAYFKIKKFAKIYAFYHAMGMSCNAGHGKLHNSMLYIEKILKEYGFEIEHENIYYSLKLKEKNNEVTAKDIKLNIKEIDKYNKQKFSFYYQNKEVGGTLITYLDGNGIVYLNWIWLEKEYTGLGLGSLFIDEIQRHLLNKRYNYLHTDTANNNYIAQKYYEKNNFINEGFTRSYFREGYK